MYGIKSVRTSFKSIQILTFVLSSFQMSFGATLSWPIEVGCRSTKGSNDPRKGLLAGEIRSSAVEGRILAGEMKSLAVEERILAGEMKSLAVEERMLAGEMKSLAVEERILAGEIRFKLPKAGIG